MCQMRGREGEKLRFKCLNSDRDGKIAKKTGIQTKREKEMNFFVLKKRHKMRFVFSSSIAVLPLYTCAPTSRMKLDWNPYYSICDCFHVTISQSIHWMTNKITCFHSFFSYLLINYIKVSV